MKKKTFLANYLLPEGPEEYHDQSVNIYFVKACRKSVAETISVGVEDKTVKRAWGWRAGRHYGRLTALFPPISRTRLPQSLNRPLQSPRHETSDNHSRNKITNSIHNCVFFMHEGYL